MLFRSAPPLPPPGCTVDPALGDLGRALVVRRILYWWPAEGWQLGTVARVSPQAAFSHVVAYHRRTSALTGTAHSLLDAASYGSTWVALSPAAPAVVSRVRPPPRARGPPRPTAPPHGPPSPPRTGATWYANVGGDLHPPRFSAALPARASRALRSSPPE